MTLKMLIELICKRDILFSLPFKFNHLSNVAIQIAELSVKISQSARGGIKIGISIII